ncbi:acyl-CoA dehydrogenase family protein [Gynuella sp.]|uniref:acyl-CoA dehydrogenase family protein n=1 Tax=Gynuella sp. TaxID=2969146 RepID=UPI003D139BBA
METITADIRFGPSVQTEPYIEELQRVAHGIDTVNPDHLTAAGVQQAVKTIRSLDIAEAGALTDTFQEQINLMYQAAKQLAIANSDAALQGLSATPAEMIAVPMTENIALRFNQNHAVMLLAAPGNESDITLLERQTSTGQMQTRTIPFSAVTSLLPSAVQTPGFVFHRLLFIPSDTFEATVTHTLVAEQWQQFKTLMLGLYGGLLVGVCQKMTESAYQYARERQSSGKPIYQHQAVALRLADITLHQEALTLYLDFLFDQEIAAADTIVPVLDYLDELTFKLSRDALQTAAGHGFVEGLPFSRLFEQVKTLMGQLHLWASVDSDSKEAV